MNKTHKKILGFAGLGLVAAITTAAATMPMDGALAVGSTSDTIQVRVTSEAPELTVSSSSGESVSTPSYTIDISYDNIGILKGTSVNRDSSGTIIHQEEILNIDTGYEAGSMSTSLSLDNLGGEGNYTITFTGMGYGGVPIERIIEFTYAVPTPEPEKKEDQEANEEGNASVDVDVPTVAIESISVDVYDENGVLVKEFNLDDPSDIENLDLSDLPDGNYTLKIYNRDKDGSIVSITTTTAIVNASGTGTGSVDITIEPQEEEIKKAVITIVDSDGNTVKVIEIENPTPGADVNVDFSDLGSGSYSVVVDYYDEDGNKINSSTTNVSKSDDSGVVPVSVETQVDTVTTIEGIVYDENGNIVRKLVADRATGTVYVYDTDGNLLYTIPNGYKDGKFIISMTDLPSGNYTTIINFKDADGNIIGNGVSVKIAYNGKAIVVPDTGSFFQGLNISREDYLVTGLVAFMVVGVVAFGIVAKNKRSHKANNSKKNRR